LRGELGGAPRQKLNSDGTHGAPSDKPEPHLVRLGGLRPYQEPITGQGLGIRVVEGQGEFLQLGRDVCLGPGMLVGLGQPTPPDFVAKAQRPRRVGQRLPAQTVAPFFLRA
jgi:hypothetical protein